MKTFKDTETGEEWILANGNIQYVRDYVVLVKKPKEPEKSEMEKWLDKEVGALKHHPRFHEWTIENGKECVRQGCRKLLDVARERSFAGWGHDPLGPRAFWLADLERWVEGVK